MDDLVSRSWLSVDVRFSYVKVKKTGPGGFVPGLVFVWTQSVRFMALSPTIFEKNNQIKKYLAHFYGVEP
ncbi:hypothetical protein EGT51_10665 [Levilactobacillus suantsaiihabitans]|uniref:Uncharacterized protein n=1 Tax=Levilactobacillus suantsaiihabitans TaxID=2487722 RepID=A0A4Z0J9W1_9LACO|nr:hypothetical protein EGT51_10665 [Levilactobacillus suantsaiihabitans]